MGRVMLACFMDRFMLACFMDRDICWHVSKRFSFIIHEPFFLKILIKQYDDAAIKIYNTIGTNRSFIIRCGYCET